MLLTEHHLGLFSLKGGGTGLSESALVKMPHFWKSYVKARMYPVVRIAVFEIFNQTRLSLASSATETSY